MVSLMTRVRERQRALQLSACYHNRAFCGRIIFPLLTKHGAVNKLLNFSLLQFPCLKNEYDI